MRKPLVAGNWKMNGSKASLNAIKALGEALTPELRARVDVLLAPPATLILAAAAAALGSGLIIGAQDCHDRVAGAHTGDVSAAMLFDAGAKAVILGHSERRSDHGESDALVKAKAGAALAQGLLVILCVGETGAQREAGKALDVVARQVSAALPEGADAARVVIAYEPVWAIGTGLTPTSADIAEVHAELRRIVARKLGRQAGADMRLLYGGSVKPENAREILALEDVDGALVGGASLKTGDFLKIIAAAP